MKSMKKAAALSAALLTIALSVSACAPEDASADQGAMAVITISPEDAGAPTQKPSESLSALDASLSLRNFFTSIDYESDSNNIAPNQLDYVGVEKAYPRALKLIDASKVSTNDTVRLIKEYTAYAKTMPSGGYVGMNPQTFQISADGTVKVKGADLFIVYREGTRYVTHKGVSMTSTDSYSNVFTLSEVDGTWKITGISF